MEPLQPVIDGVENMSAAIFAVAGGIILAAFLLIGLYEGAVWLMGLFKSTASGDTFIGPRDYDNMEGWESPDGSGKAFYYRGGKKVREEEWGPRS
jgi:hypothetical protein